MIALVTNIALILALQIISANSMVTPSGTEVCPKCPCPKHKNPICAMVSEDEDLVAKFYNFENECEFICLASCMKERVKFLHCGSCDSRPLLPKGHKGFGAMMSCLRVKARKPFTQRAGDTCGSNSKSACGSKLKLATIDTGLGNNLPDVHNAK